jgi:hypothetical protein
LIIVGNIIDAGGFNRFGPSFIIEPSLIYVDYYNFAYCYFYKI